MAVDTLAYALDGIALKISTGLNDATHKLQEAARILRWPDEERRKPDPGNGALSGASAVRMMEEAATELQDLQFLINSLAFEARYYTKPAPVPESPSETLHKDYPEGVTYDDTIPF